MKMTRLTILLGFGFLVSLTGCAVLAYLLIDRSITLSYVTQSVDTCNTSMRHMKILLESEWSGMSEDKIFQKLKLVAARHPADQIVIKKEEGVIWFDEIRFNFESNRLKKIGKATP